MHASSSFCFVVVLSDESFNVHLLLDTTPKSYLVLSVTYPEEYPQIIPELTIEVSDGEYLSQTEDEEEDQEDGPNDDLMEFTDQDITTLLNQLNDSAEENIGIPSIFTLASLLKDSAEELHATKIKRLEQQREKIILEQEAKEQEKFRGTPVTAESFNAWRLKFKQEQEQKITENGGVVKQDKTKMSGRELFEKGLNKDEEDEDDLAQQVDSLSIEK